MHTLLPLNTLALFSLIVDIQKVMTCYVLGAPPGPRGPWATRDPASARWSDRGRCTRAPAPNCGTTCSRLTLSSRTPPCPPTRRPAPSSSWRRCAGGLRRRRLSLGLCNPSKGKWSGHHGYLSSSFSTESISLDPQGTKTVLSFYL